MQNVNSGTPTQNATTPFSLDQIRPLLSSLAQYEPVMNFVWTLTGAYIVKGETVDIAIQHALRDLPLAFQHVHSVLVQGQAIGQVRAAS